MFCNRCGKSMQETDVFCPACGLSVRPNPLMPSLSQLTGHIRMLGIFWIALSAVRLLPGIILLAVFENPDFPPGAPAFVHSLVNGIAMLLIILGAGGICAGIGLLNRAPWARALAIALGCVSLVEVPLGTALGIYTLWALLPAKSEEEYRKLAGEA